MKKILESLIHLGQRKQVISLCLIHGSIDYSLFHYIVEVDTPKRAWNIRKEVFSDEPAVEECDCVSHANHQESHSEVEDGEEDFVASDNVIPPKVVDLVVLVDDNKPINVLVPSNVSDILSKQETIDKSIEDATVIEN